MQQCVRDYLFAHDSGYTCGDWREMRASAYFFINESSLRTPLNIVLYDDGERVEIVERSGCDKTTKSVANADELWRFLASHVPVGEQLEGLRRAAKDSLDAQVRIEAVRNARVKTAEACVQPEDVARLAGIIADSMKRSLQVITVTGRQSLIRKTMFMLELSLDAALPAPTEY